ncbi:MAG: hypothetical protein IT337_07970 [Thermomicrobiales bacterium]|nr:hypothetical protein [Thermomicrobiales bacterium]
MASIHLWATIGSEVMRFAAPDDAAVMASPTSSGVGAMCLTVALHDANRLLAGTFAPVLFSVAMAGAHGWHSLFARAVGRHLAPRYGDNHRSAPSAVTEPSYL